MAFTPNRTEEYYKLRKKIDTARELLDRAERNAEKGYYDVAWDYLLDVSVETDTYRTIYSKQSYCDSNDYIAKYRYGEFLG